MNLSPLWVEALQDGGHSAVHWSTLGSGGAPDSEILLWARTQGHAVLTNDLDFTAILASSGGQAPSVVQLRMQDLLPDTAARIVLGALTQFAGDLERGALVTVDPTRARARKLPLR